MTEKEYKYIDSKICEASKLRKAVQDARDRLELFDHEVVSAMAGDGYFLICTWSGLGNTRIPYNESTKRLLDNMRDFLVADVEKAERELAEYRI